jgi:ArsR family transcriptional regulator
MIPWTRFDRKQAVRVFRALSDPTRLSILERLRYGERCVCELTDALDAAQSRLSFHLKVLKDAGLVSDRREGRWMYYTLEPDALTELGELVQAIGAAPSAAERRAGCC